MTKNWDAIWVNARLVTCVNGYGMMDEAAIAVKGDKIAWLGTMKQLPGTPASLASDVYDVNGACIVPGFIDCHTHLVYGGNRAQEFERRLNGESYTSIAKSGGGIQSTVAATRAASEQSLFESALFRVQQMMQHGTSVIEIKSGYGLDLETELKLLRVIRRLKQSLPITITATFLGAHVVPVDYKNDPDAYVDYVIETMLPEIASEKLADAVDVFCESIAFTLQQTKRIFEKAMSLGLKIKCHAEQLSHTGAAELAANLGAQSVDHLEHLKVADIAAMRKNQTVAVLLPGAFYFLQETKLPPIDELRKQAIAMALATDANPGTSPIYSLTLILSMACLLYKFTPEEALLGITIHAAAALGLEKEVGSLAVGKRANFNTWAISHPSELSYYMGIRLLQTMVIDGKLLNE